MQTEVKCDSTNIMLEKFKAIVEAEFDNFINKEIFLAISGGKDSMALSSLLLKSNISHTLLHCNFQLRGQESEQDETFLKEYAYNNRGYLYIKLKQYELAIADFDKAIELNLEYGEAYENRGIAKELIGDLESACIDWDKAAELGMDFSYVYLSNDCQEIESE